MRRNTASAAIIVSAAVCIVLCRIQAVGFLADAPLLGLLVEFLLFAVAAYFGRFSLLRNTSADVVIFLLAAFSVYDKIFAAVKADVIGERSLFAPAVAIIAVSALCDWIVEKTEPAPTDVSKVFDGLIPESGTVLRNGAEKAVPASDISEGDIVAVHPGERVPCDGEIIAGRSELDERILTGNILPVFKSEGGRVKAGSINLSGFLTVRADGDKGELNGLIRSCRDAKSGDSDRFFRVFMRLFGIACTAIAVVFGVLSLFLYGIDSAMFTVAAVFAAGYSGVLKLTKAIARAYAAKRGASEGLRFRDKSALGRIDAVSVAVIDRTGTATVGKLTVTKVISLGALNEASIIRIAAALCAGFDGADFDAITEKCRLIDVAVPPCISPERLIGRICGKVDGRCAELSSLCEDVEPFAEDYPEVAGKPLRLLLVGDEAVGLIALGDSIKPNAVAAVREFKRRGIKTVLVSGTDDDVKSDAVALGADSFICGLNGEQKADYVRQLRENGETVLVAAEGVSDSAALSAADCSFALSSGDEAAKQFASAVLVRNDLRDIFHAMELSTASRRSERLGLTVVSAVNAASLAAAGTVGALGGIRLIPVIITAGLMLSAVTAAVACIDLRKHNTKK